MGGWREVKLGAILELKYGKDHKTLSDGDIPVYGSGGIMRYADAFLYDEESILIPRKGTLNNIFYIDGKKPFWTVDTIFWSKINTKLTFGRFLFYYLKTINFVNLNVGSAVPSLTTKVLNEVDILLPTLQEQKAIAEVLSSLDDKIDLLHRQNKTLEELAQTLFRQWFIEEVGDDWEVGKLPDEFNFTMGLSPKGETFNEVKIGTPMYQGNADFEFRFPKNRVYTTNPKRYAEKFDTLISVRAPVGAQNMAKEKCCIGRGVAAFKYKENNSFYTYTYFKMKSLMDKIKQFNDSGTVFGSINKTDFESMEVTIPPSDLIVKYQNEVKDLDDKVIQNTFQIVTLENTIDTLLPKLMSGEIKIQLIKEITCK